MSEKPAGSAVELVEEAELEEGNDRREHRDGDRENGDDRTTPKCPSPMRVPIEKMPILRVTEVRFSLQPV